MSSNHDPGDSGNKSSSDDRLAATSSSSGSEAGLIAAPTNGSSPTSTMEAKAKNKDNVGRKFWKSRSEKKAEKKFSMFEGVKMMGRQLSETILAVDGLASKVGINYMIVV